MLKFLAKNVLFDYINLCDTVVAANYFLPTPSIAILSLMLPPQTLAIE
jgi:hypothetical protein